jgi:UPF0716 protein FxsA
MILWLLVIIPLIELYILLLVSEHIGLLNTVALVVGTGILGMLLAKQQGLAVLLKVRQQLSEGRMPAEPLLDGLFVLIGALLLLTPGLLTDFIGFCCLLPFTRRIFSNRLRILLLKMLGQGSIKILFWR